MPYKSSTNNYAMLKSAQNSSCYFNEIATSIYKEYGDIMPVLWLPYQTRCHYVTNDHTHKVIQNPNPVI